MGLGRSKECGVDPGVAMLLRAAWRRRLQAHAVRLMADAVSLSPAPPSKAAACRAQGSAPPCRADGAAKIAVVRRGGRTRLAGLSQRGSAKCMIPHVPGRVEGITLNTAGGITGGDRFHWQASAGRDATLTMATQTAERLYKAEAGATARVTTQSRRR